MMAYKNIFCLWQKPGKTNVDYNKLFHPYKTFLKSLEGLIPAPSIQMLEPLINTGAVKK